MAYGLLLYKEIASPEGTHRLEVYKDGYSGSDMEIDGLVRDSINISKNASEVSDPIVTSVLTFALYDTGQLDYTQFFTPNATLYKVVLKHTIGTTTTTRWTGFLTPDSYSENLASRDIITLTARDNLGRLNDYDFSLARGQMLSVRSIINAGLGVAGVAMDVSFTTTKVATSPDTILAVDGLVNTSLLIGMTWHEAVTLLLEGLGLTLSWNDSNIFEVRDITQAPSDSQAAFFISKSGYRMIRPAWKNLTAEQDYGLRDNFYEGQLTKDDCGDTLTFTPPQTSKWGVDGTMALLNAYKGAPSPLETLYIPIAGGDAITNAIKYSFLVPNIQRPIKISMQCNNSVWIWRDPADYYGYTGLDCIGSLYTRQRGGLYYYEHAYLRFRFNLFMTVGGTRYVMREGWQVYDPTTITEPYLYFVMPPSVNEYGQYVALDMDNEVSLYVNNVPGAGTMELVIYPVACQTKEDGEPTSMADAFTPNEPNYLKTGYGRITNITMQVDEGVQGRANLITVNAVHNVQSKQQFSLGQVPEGRGNTLLYLGGLFYTDTYNTPLTTFKRASADTVSYDLLELVSRERISFNDTNYNQLSGTMKASSAFRFDKGITFDGVQYRIVSASLAVLSNTLSVSAMQTEPEFDDEELYIEEVDSEGGYASRGSYSGSSVPQGTPSGGGYWEKLDDDNIKTDYDINIPESQGSGSGSGSGSGDVTYKNVSEILRHLSLVTQNNKTYLVCDISLVTNEEAVAGGIEEGGGGGGGSLASLSDVTLTNLTGGQFLRYNDTTHHWENVTPSLTMLSEIAISSASAGQVLAYNGSKWANKTLALNDISNVSDTGATNGQALVWDSTNNVWKPGTVATTVESADADIGTSLTTLATIGGTQIKAKITHQSLSGYATQSWVNQQGFATEYWVGTRGYLTSVPAATDSAYGGFKTGYSESGKNYAVQLSSGKAYVNVPWTDTVYTHPTNGANVTITAANGKVLSAITVDSLGHVTSVSSKTLAAADIPDLSGSYLPISGGTLTGNLRLKDSGSYGLSLYFGDSSNCYLQEDTDNHLTIYASKGINLLCSSSSYPITFGSSALANKFTFYGSTSDCLTIYGGSSYSTNIYRNSSGLQISSATAFGGNVTVSGNMDCTGEATAGTASDRRLKENVKTMDVNFAAEVLGLLRPVTFDWNEEAVRLSEGRKKGRSRGFIADEYNSIIPNATRKIWGIYDAIDYQHAIPYLVGGWKQHDKRIADLENEVEKLRAENEKMKNILRNYGEQ